MKKNLKKLLLLMMAMLLMLSFVACSSDDDDDNDDKDDDKKTEASDKAGDDSDDDDKKKDDDSDDEDDKKKDDDDSDDDDDKPSNVITNGKAEAEDVAESFLGAFEDLDLDKMSKYVVDDIEMFDEDTMEIYEQFEDGKFTYDEEGFKCDMLLEVDSNIDDIEEIDIDDLKDYMKDSESYDKVDFDEVSEVYEVSATIDMKLKYDNMEIDYSKMGMTEAEVAELEASLGMTLEDYMKSILDESFEDLSEQSEVYIYVANYDGDWKVIFAD